MKSGCPPSPCAGSSDLHDTRRSKSAVSCTQAVLSVPLRGVSLAPLRSLLRPQPGLAAFAPPPPPPPSGAVLADRQASDPSNVRALLEILKLCSYVPAGF